MTRKKVHSFEKNAFFSNLFYPVNAEPWIWKASCDYPYYLFIDYLFTQGCDKKCSPSSTCPVPLSYSPCPISSQLSWKNRISHPEKSHLK
jgi:hypothetical protein